ncbi:MAG: hypothetical protein U1E10_08635 [Bdellovibrionales bacterium]|nr:hypothetical protein [Bdellovibrionales bacterium]
MHIMVVMKKLNSAFVLSLLLLATGPASAATYRLELKSGSTVLQAKNFEFSKGLASKGTGFQHPHSAGVTNSNLAIEIGDAVSACGTYLQVKRKYEPKKGTFDVVGAMVTLVEKSTIQSGKMNAQTSDSDKIEKKNDAVSVKNSGLDRTCTLAVVK